MGKHALAVVMEVFIGLLLAGVIVGAIVPFAHATIGPGGAALIGVAAVVLVVVAGELLRRRRPSQP